MMRTPNLPRPTYANVMSSIALFVALGGASYAASSVAPGSVGTKQLRNGAVTQRKLAFDYESGSVFSHYDGRGISLEQSCPRGAVKCPPPGVRPIAQTSLRLARPGRLMVAANNVVTLVNALVDALQALVNAVFGAVTGNTDPLAALGNITVQTKAVAASTTQTPVAEAKIGSVKVLGNNSVPSQLTSALGAVTSTLSSVLTSVAGVAFTPPSIAVGTGKTSTSNVGDTRKATASITGVTVTLPSIAMPTALSTITTAVPGAATIAGNVVSVLGGSVKVGTLAESAAYTPSKSTTSSSGTPSGSKTPNGPSLAGTGMSPLVPAVAALLILGALALLHRRFRTTS